MRQYVARRPDRHLILIGVASFAVAGMLTACAIPLAASTTPGTDLWFTARDGTATTAMLLGLLLSLTGTTWLQSLGLSRRRRVVSRPHAATPLPIRSACQLPPPMTGESPVIVPPELHPDPQSDGTLPLELEAQVQCRDRDLRPEYHTTARLEYRPTDPYAMHLHIYHPTCPEVVHWAGSRDAFISAGCHGVPLPGLDMVVTAVQIEHSDSGGQPFYLPALRIALHETDGYRHTGEVMYMDFSLNRALRSFLEQIIRAVPPGSEHRHLDMDGAIARLFQMER